MLVDKDDRDKLEKDLSWDREDDTNDYYRRIKYHILLDGKFTNDKTRIICKSGAEVAGLRLSFGGAEMSYMPVQIFEPFIDEEDDYRR